MTKLSIASFKSVVTKNITHTNHLFITKCLETLIYLTVNNDAYFKCTVCRIINIPKRFQLKKLFIFTIFDEIDTV